jgi:predicted nuclease with TOPRIM domain
MSEDLTRKMPSSFEERVLAELGAIRQENAQLGTRMDSLEARMSSLETRMTSLESHVVSVDERLISLDERLSSLEDKVDARLRETRPIWEGVRQRLTEIEKGLGALNRQFGTLIKDSFDLRSRVEKLEDGQTV